jgi:antitoxin (DNA-binding transcriptional repressor) of toxin-antitoxin stability system
MSDAKTIEVISIGDLGEHARDVLQRIRDSRETIDVVDGEQVIARITPVQTQSERKTRDEWWQEVMRLGEEISKHWPEGVSAEEAISEQRREL